MTEQVPVPVQLLMPVQPEKLYPVPAVAVRTTVVPCAKLAVQALAGQLMPPAELVTVPLPDAGAVTVS